MQKALKSKGENTARTMTPQEQAESQAQQEQYLKFQELCREFLNKEIYEGLPSDFSYRVRQALSHFSDAILKMPYDIYRNIALIKDQTYTYQQVDIALQVLSMANADQLIMGLGEYITFKDKIQEVATEYNKSLEAHKLRIKESITVVPAGEA